MELHLKKEGRCLEIYLKGDLDHHGAKGLLNRLDREVEVALPARLILDFGGVTFMDSSGIAVAMRARQRIKELGGTLQLRNTPAQSRKVFEAAGIGRLIEIV